MQLFWAFSTVCCNCTVVTKVLSVIVYLFKTIKFQFYDFGASFSVSLWDFIGDHNSLLQTSVQVFCYCVPDTFRWHTFWNVRLERACEVLFLVWAQCSCHWLAWRILRPQPPHARLQLDFHVWNRNHANHHHPQNREQSWTSPDQMTVFLFLGMMDGDKMKCVASVYLLCFLFWICEGNITPLLWNRHQTHSFSPLLTCWLHKHLCSHTSPVFLI